MRRMIYFRDTKTVECWQVIAGAWMNLNDRFAFDDLNSSDWDYFAFDTKPQGWLGDKNSNPMPYIQI